MAIARKCDRCGGFFEFYTVMVNDESTSIGFNTLTQGCYSHEDGCHHKKSYDLCRECCKEFNEWLDKPVRID